MNEIPSARMCQEHTTGLWLSAPPRPKSRSSIIEHNKNYGLIFMIFLRVLGFETKNKQISGDVEPHPDPGVFSHF